ncbi:hypothetical protein [Ornithinimicrobium pratense]|uniref:Uncharacterized protein n=1 Tax=Ornithinimicrobium pratense TaxID=2593973 RepID=A0A5J6V5W5_9MICO|nr:hypothetical protein [Ornithinimicrobium pratense]QFG68704.1 hypothetical protein FY030_08235 [Ornithinimicrobium pratense]
MTVRPALPSDIAPLTIPWLTPDEDLESGVSLVEEVGGRLVAAGVRHFTRTKAAQDAAELYCEEGHGAPLLRELATAAKRPIMLRIIPGTPAESAAAAAGARVIQSVPAAYFPTTHAQVQDWARRQLDLAEKEETKVAPGSHFSMDVLLDLWMAPYLRMHASWAPTQDVHATRESFGARFAQDLDLERTRIATVDGGPVAAVFTVGPFDGTFMPILIEIKPEHPGRERAARAAIASMLTATAPTPVEFDGHADEPVYMRILKEIPQRTRGKLTPMNLVEIN